jgi:hypothetical protein
VAGVDYPSYLLWCASGAGLALRFRREQGFYAEAVLISEQNVERLRASIEAFLTGTAGTSESDREGMLTKIAELWDPDIEMDSTENSILDISGVYRGKDAIKQVWREWLAAWENLRFEYELVDAGERVLMLFDLRMRGRSTGIEMPFGKVAWVYTFKDGLIVHEKFYMSQAEALEAVGLSEDARATS